MPLQLGWMGQGTGWTGGSTVTPRTRECAAAPLHSHCPATGPPVLLPSHLGTAQTTCHGPKLWARQPEALLGQVCCRELGWAFCRSLCEVRGARGWASCS